MRRLLNKSGQMALEMILIMALMVGFATFVTSEFKSSNFVAQLVSGPWKNLAGMIQNGVWGPSADTMPQHPNAFNRVISPDGETPE